MNPPFEVILNHGLLFDAVGFIGLGLLTLAAIKLARRNQSWGGSMLVFGSLAVLLARFYLVISQHFITDDVLHSIGPIGISLTIGMPPLFLSLGLAGIVWGLWGHERWLHDETR